MPYFDPSADTPERAGKIIGDIFATLMIVALIAIFVQSMITR